jgi:sec-independent protein translocase protein TatB
MSFGTLCVLVMVAIVVIGPKDLPRYLRKGGQLAGKLRRMASDARAQSGIDEVIRTEGLTKEIAEIRSLARGDFIGSIGSIGSFAPPRFAPQRAFESPLPIAPSSELLVMREREYPSFGADSYGAISETAGKYAKGLEASPLAKEPLYVVGDADAELPPVTPEAEEPASALAHAEVLVEGEREVASAEGGSA